MFIVAIFKSLCALGEQIRFSSKFVVGGRREREEGKRRRSGKWRAGGLRLGPYPKNSKAILFSTVRRTTPNDEGHSMVSYNSTRPLYSGADAFSASHFDSGRNSSEMCWDFAKCDSYTVRLRVTRPLPRFSLCPPVSPSPQNVNKK